MESNPKSYKFTDRIDTLDGDQNIVLRLEDQESEKEGVIVYTIMAYTTENYRLYGPIKVRVTFPSSFLWSFTEDELRELVHHGNEGNTTLEVLYGDPKKKFDAACGRSNNTHKRLFALLGFNAGKILRAAIGRGGEYVVPFTVHHRFEEV